MAKENFVMWMDQLIKEIIRMVKYMGKENFVVMEKLTLEILMMAYLTEKENFFMLADQLIKESGRMVKDMGKESIAMLMDQLAKASGRIIK